MRKMHIFTPEELFSAFRTAILPLPSPRNKYPNLDTHAKVHAQRLKKALKMPKNASESPGTFSAQALVRWECRLPSLFPSHPSLPLSSLL